MAIWLGIIGIIVALIAAMGPGILFLMPWLPPAVWYKFDRTRNIILTTGSGLIILAILLNVDLLEILLFVPLLTTLRSFLRPEMVIRALDKPRHLPATIAQLPPNHYVLATEINGKAWAWPEVVVIAHHLVHDRIGGEPILASW